MDHSGNSQAFSDTSSETVSSGLSARLTRSASTRRLRPTNLGGKLSKRERLSP
jgi:hypothetical protein